jgi:polyisoprenoid-binding protein YceI
MRIFYARFSWLLAWFLCVSWMSLSQTVWAWQDTTRNATPQVSAGDVELRTSRVYTFVDKTGLGHQHAIEGWLKPSRLLLNAKENAGTLVFDMNSFDADTDSARRFLGLEGSTSASTRQQVNQNMKGRDILDTTRYPESTFLIHSSLPTGKLDSKKRPEFELQGEFTLHGVTKPLRVLYYVEKARGWIRILGQFPIKQTDFSIKPYSKALGAIGVANELRIHGAIWLAPPESLDLANVPEIKQ